MSIQDLIVMALVGEAVIYLVWSRLPGKGKKPCCGSCGPGCPARAKSEGGKSLRGGLAAMPPRRNGETAGNKPS